ncbi:uncharacterized protein TRUGW13939_09731 [Talaromyces rugulosus]|uniref:Uncharacterized protein n=1 Tax=Talaromyces rugulosus TaxID=121627 RepID=A0A7H8R859_TALRU|nr:uncharacterized protein TRUGW13939_09731 [Talaromyces rugulosus]QKX62570.1 hypothetical protein TRUGW13939_09731 [Talaromyces rugulosus]
MEKLRKNKPNLNFDTKWKPGLTEQGEDIVGMAPTRQTTALNEVVPIRCKFAVYKPTEKNKIAYVDSSELGERACKGYLKDIPDSGRLDLGTGKQGFTRADRAKVGKVVGFDCDPETAPNRYPTGVVLVTWEAGEFRVMNRSDFRKIMTMKCADKMIEDFHIKNDLPFKFSKRVSQGPISRSSSRSNTPDLAFESHLETRLTQLDNKLASYVEKSDQKLNDFRKEIDLKFEAMMTAITQQSDKKFQTIMDDFNGKFVEIREGVKL